MTYSVDVRYQDSEGQWRTRTEYRFTEQSKRILIFNVPLSPMISKDVGQYEIPFCFEIPERIPSSFINSNGQSVCEISFKLLAKTQGDVSMVNIYSFSEIGMRILQRPISYPSSPILINPFTELVKTCSCFTSGRMSFGAEATDTRIGSGES